MSRVPLEEQRTILQPIGGNHRLASDDQDARSPRILPQVPWGLLPPRISLLLVCQDPEMELAIESLLASDSATRLEMRRAIDAAQALKMLRNAPFDVVLLTLDSGGDDIFHCLDGVRTGSRANQAVLVMGRESNLDMEAACLESGADAYLCLANVTARSFIWQLVRAMERQSLLAENDRLQANRSHHRRQDRDEVEVLLDQEWELAVANARDCHGVNPPYPSGAWPGSGDRRLQANYKAILQAFSLMGSGTLGQELDDFIDHGLEQGLLPREFLAIHVATLREIVRELGPRSARHVAQRGNVLAVDLLVRLAELPESGRFLAKSTPPRRQPE